MWPSWRLSCVVATLTVALIPWPLSGAAEFDRELRLVMAPYYAALVASARGDSDAAHRQILRFAALWSTAAPAWRTSAPSPLGGDPYWRWSLDRVSDAIGRAREHARKRDAVSAHAELESIRLTLRDARARYHVTTLDDRVTEWHEAMERLLARIPGMNEIVLGPADVQSIQRELQSTRAVWMSLAAAGKDASAVPGWAAAVHEICDHLSSIDRAAADADGAALAAGARDLKTAYFDLLLALSRPAAGGTIESR